MPGNPHDDLFKAVFSQTEHGAGLLRALLPSGVVARLEWESLALVAGTFVDAQLGQRHSDLLFSVRLGGGAMALVYVLVEHQSEIDPWMALRLHGYVDRIWQRWRKDNPQREELPAVVPIVVHHGRAGWSAARALSELYDLDTETLAMLAPLLPELRFVLDDLARVPIEELERRAMTDLGRLALFLLKRARVSPDILAELRLWIESLRRLVQSPLGWKGFELLMGYTMKVSHVELEAARAMVEDLGSDGPYEVGTTAQKLWDAGRAEMMIELLQARFGSLDSSVVSRVRGASADELARWVQRIVTAASIDEVFAGD